MNPSIQQTYEDQEKAVFDPAITADISNGRVKGERLARSGSATEVFTADTAEGVISLKQYFPTGTLKLLRLPNPKGPSIWQRKVALVHQPDRRGKGPWRLS